MSRDETPALGARGMCAPVLVVVASCLWAYRFAPSLAPRVLPWLRMVAAYRFGGP